MFTDLGRKPEGVNEVIREKYARRLERMKTAKEKAARRKELKSVSGSKGD